MSGRSEKEIACMSFLVFRLFPAAGPAHAPAERHKGARSGARKIRSSLSGMDVLFVAPERQAKRSRPRSFLGWAALRAARTALINVLCLGTERSGPRGGRQRALRDHEERGGFASAE